MAQMPDAAIAEQPLPAVPTDSTKSSQKKNVLLPAVIILIVVLVVVGAILVFTPFSPKQDTNYKVLAGPVNSAKGIQRALNERGVFDKEKIMAKIGGETIYGNDLNYALLTTFYDKITQKTLSLEKLKELALQKVSQDSITLQVAQKKNLIELTKDIFNNPLKNYQLRQQAISEAASKLQGEQETVSAETLSIWFYNMEPPLIPQDQAEQTAKQKMEQIRNDIVSGKLTFEQAKTQIQNDSTLAKLDRNYKGNAYFAFENRPSSEGFFSTTGMDKLLLSMKEGEISPVLRAPKDPNNPSEEKFYYIIKLTKKTNPQNGSFVQLLDTERSKYPVEIL